MRHVSLCSLLLLACGPAVQSDDPQGSDGGGATEPSADESSGGDDASSSSGSGREPLCGDGIVEPGEACDDGNDRNADGCSARCQDSGTIAWSQGLAPGFGVGLTSRDGAAVAAVQQFDGIETAVVIDGFDAEGVMLGEHVDEGGLSDLDLARNPVELLSDGRVALAYPVHDGTSLVRYFGVLELGAGTVQGFVDDSRWTRVHGVAADSVAIRVLHADEDGQLVMETFDAEADHLSTEPMGAEAAQERPLIEGAVLRRALPMGIALTQGEADVRMWTFVSGSNYDVPVADAPAPARPVAFSDGLYAWIWTGDTLLRTDEMDHIAETSPRSFDGELLWADAFGLVVAAGDDLVLYDEEGAQRLTVTLPPHPDTGDTLAPRFVRPDLEGAGLFVLADQGIPPDGSSGSVALHYVVR